MTTKKAQPTPIDTLGRECEVSLELGQVVMTAALHHSAISEPLLWDYITLCVERHRSGDWGELDPEDSLVVSVARTITANTTNTK